MAIGSVEKQLHAGESPFAFVLPQTETTAELPEDYFFDVRTLITIEEKLMLAEEENRENPVLLKQCENLIKTIINTASKENNFNELRILHVLKIIDESVASLPTKKSARRMLKKAVRQVSILQHSSKHRCEIAKRNLADFRRTIQLKNMISRIKDKHKWYEPVFQHDLIELITCFNQNKNSKTRDDDMKQILDILEFHFDVYHKQETTTKDTMARLMIHRASTIYTKSNSYYLIKEFQTKIRNK